MTKRKPDKRNETLKRRVFLFGIAAILVVIAAILWGLSELSPTWASGWSWLKPAAFIVGTLAVAVPVLGSLYSDILLPLTERSDSLRPPGARELRDEAPLLKVTHQTLIKDLGNGGEIPWVERGVASLALLYQYDRIVIIGPMKSGKTREAIELIRIAEQNGLVSAVFRPAAAINLIDPERLVAAITVQLDQPCLFFIDDIGALQDDAYLERLSICIDTIAHHRPDARFVITLQTERLRVSDALQSWVEKHRFHSVLASELTAAQRSELVGSGIKALAAKLTPGAGEILSNNLRIVRPWDVVWVLQSALGRRPDALPLTDRDIEALISEGELAVWSRQRQNLIQAEPATAELLESIGAFFSAGVTPREEASCALPLIGCQTDKTRIISGSIC